MSVLYKALARAARSRQALQGPVDFPAQEMPVISPRRRFRIPRSLLILPVALIIVGGGAWFMFGDQIDDFIAGMSDTPPPPQTAIVPKLPPAAAPRVATTPTPAQVAAAGSPSAPPAAAPAPAGAPPLGSSPPAGTAANPPPPAVASVNVAATPTTTTTTTTSTTSATSAPQPPAPLPPAAVATVPATPAASAPAPATAAPAPPIHFDAAPVPVAPPSAVAIPVPAAPAPITPSTTTTVRTETRSVTSPPAAPRQVAPPQVAIATPAAAPTPDTNLPAVLERIRQQNAKAALGAHVSVDRAAGQDAPDSQKQPFQVSVLEPTASDRDAADHTFDLLVHGQYQSALAIYDDVLKNQPHMLSAMEGRATALQKLGRSSEARGSYRQVLAIDPQNREALTNMTALAATDAPQQAQQELRDLERLYPEFSPIAAGLAQIEANQGDVRSAVAELGRAVALSPENGLYRLDLAILQDRAGLASDAATSYQAALDRLGSGSGDLPVPIDQIRARMRFLQGR